MRLDHPYILLLAGMVPALVALYRWADRQRSQAHARFQASQSSAPRQVSVSRRRWKRICVLTAAFSLIFALARPTWNRPPAAPAGNTGDIVFLLDVSRSMLSADVSPSRLGRAKSIVAGLYGELHGERTALVEFAGTPSVECPLTIDQAFFQTALEHAAPASVARGGTDIGDAIQFALDSVFDDVERTRKELVILTDGGDQDSVPTNAAGAAKSRGIAVLVIGVGDEQKGALVPTSESDPTPILYRGQKVLTKLDLGVLESIARAAGGVFLNGTGPVDLATIYRQFIASAKSAPGRDRGTSASGWLILLVVVLLIIETMLSDRRTRGALVAVILIAELSAQTPTPTPVWEPLTDAMVDPQTQADWILRGNTEYEDKHWDKAAASYQNAGGFLPVWPQTYFNLGMALYRGKKYAPASEAFGKAAALWKGTPDEATSKLGQANCAFRQAMDAPPHDTVMLLRKVLRSYEELSAIEDAKFNADVVRRLLSDNQNQGPPTGMPETPSTRKKASTPEEIVQQGGVPQRPTAQRVDRDW